MTKSPAGRRTLRRIAAIIGYAKARLASVRSAVRVGLAVSLAGAASCVGGFASPAVAHAEYHSFFEGYVPSGQYVRDSDPPYEHGGYHTWLYGESWRLDRPVQPLLCIVAWTGSGYESGSECSHELSFAFAAWPNRANAEAEMYGVAYDKGYLTMQGEVTA